MTANHTPTHDLAIARAERDAWQSTCEELHRAIAGRDVEIESHLGRCEAADQRARSLDAALTAEREAGKGLVAQVEALRADSRHHAAIAAQNATLASERDAANAELAAIRDLVAPGNPQGTVVDAVRARLDAVENAQAFGIRERDAAIARAKKAESDLSELTAARDRLLAREHEDSRLHAQLRAELAELRARPVLTVEAFTEAYIKTKHGGKAWPGEEADRRGLTAQFRATFAALGPVTLPSPDRAEELCRAYHERAADMDGHMVGRWQYHGPESQAICTEAMERALASLGAPPTSPPAARPVFAGVSEDELIRLFYVVGTDGIDHGEKCPPIDISDRNGIRAVLARLEVSLVAPVDPEKFARNAYNSRRGPLAWDGVLTAEGRKALADEARHALTASGIPVTPERK